MAIQFITKLGVKKILFAARKIAMAALCCDHPYCCGNCDDLTWPERMPVELAVTITGLADGTCADCDTINGTAYVVQSFATCQWKYDFETPICGSTWTRIRVQVAFTGSNHLQVYLETDGGVLAMWDRILATMNCLAFDVDVDPYNPGGYAICLSGGSSAHVETVAA